MNLPRLRELAKAGLDGTLRPEEARELFEALPEVITALEPASEEVLMAEASVMRYPVMNNHMDIVSVANRAYVAGALRSGRRHVRG